MTGEIHCEKATAKRADLQVGEKAGRGVTY